MAGWWVRSLEFAFGLFAHEKSGAGGADRKAAGERFLTGMYLRRYGLWACVRERFNGERLARGRRCAYNPALRTKEKDAAEMSEEKKGMLAAGAAYGIFGLSYLFSKIGLEITQPVILLCLRFSVTVVLMNLLVALGVLRLDLKGKKRKMLWAPILLGLLQPVLYFYLENYGLKYTTTSFTGMVSATNPIFTAIAGALILRERPNRKQWLCMGLSIAGVLMVSLQTASSGQNTVTGCVCLIAAYAVGSLYSLLVRRLSREYTPFELTYVMFTVGFIAFAAHALIQYGAGAFGEMGFALSHPRFIVAILYLGGLSSVGAYMLANYSLAKLTVARSTIFSCMGTVVSVLAGVLIMKDQFSLLSLGAFVCILIGVWGVNRFATDEKE